MFDSWSSNLTEQFQQQLASIENAVSANGDKIRTLELSLKRLFIMLKKFIDEHEPPKRT